VKESGRFLKKAAQKLLFRWAMGGDGDTAHGPALAKFFCFFLFTKRSLPCACLTNIARNHLKIFSSQGDRHETLLFAERLFDGYSSVAGGDRRTL
jgi:hypothetical protein